MVWSENTSAHFSYVSTQKKPFHKPLSKLTQKLKIFSHFHLFDKKRNESKRMTAY